ncbi:MAG: DUF1648 domain-containing protein [Bacillota bacterium]
MVKIAEWPKMFSYFSFIALLLNLMHVIMVWTEIPSSISIHFINGEPDRWGSKLFLLIMPLVGLLLWWLLGKLAKHPEKFNYINLTDKNREKQYKMTGKVMVLIQNLSLLAFVLANEEFLRNAAGSNSSNIFLVLSIVSMGIIPLAFFYNLVWAARLKD